MLRDFPIATWLLAWALGVVLFMMPILLINVLTAITLLRRNGIPRPAFVVFRRVLGLLPIRARLLYSLVGRTAFVAWDRRWVDAGETIAIVNKCSDATGEIELHLDRPIGNVRIVTFRPHHPARASFRFGSVRGTLSPPIDGVTPTAEVVVYMR